jgi:3-methyladenine DNA glycosylase/8-oxoguanine DNA glycosylase
MLGNFADILDKTKNFWSLSTKTFFHHAVSQYVTQKIRFEQSRRIRAKLYAVLGDPYDQNAFNKLSDIEYNNLGLNSEQIKTLRIISANINISDDNEHNLDRLQKITGIGPWTIKSIQLTCRMNGWEQLTLEEDSYIRKRLSEIYDLNSLTTVRAKKLIIVLSSTHQVTTGEICLFMWRLKSSGIINLKQGHILTQTDFL